MAVLWLKGNMPKFDKLPDDEIRRCLERMKPTKEIDGVLHALSPFRTKEGSPVTLWNTAFMWEPEVLEQVEGPLYDLAFIETYHPCGYIACFKPTLGEVISQIPEHLIEDVTHFEVVMGDTVGCYTEGDGHRTMTKLYTPYNTSEQIDRALARDRAKRSKS